MAVGVHLPVTPDEAIARAMSMRGDGPIGKLWRPSSRGPAVPLTVRPKYGLGEGGTDPLEPTPFTPDEKKGNRPACDCSGFACWCLRFSRQQMPSAFSFGGGYASTHAMIAEARKPGSHWFEIIARPRRGALVVYGNRYKGGERVRVGHVGLVAEAPAEWAGGTEDDFMRTRVVHCCSSKSGGGIAYTTAQPWYGNDRQGYPKDAVFLWYRRYGAGL